MEIGDELSDVEVYFNKNKGDEKESSSKGIVSKGSLVNGKLFPFLGENYQYFDTLSYLEGRAFSNQLLLNSVLDTYKDFQKLAPNRFFYIMECSNAHGGKMYPHRTHQNGMSIDFMMPLLKNNDAFYGLDSIGKDHYWLEFDDEGKYSKDPSISIDFDLIAQHILHLDKNARKNGIKISKVIIKIEMKDELFASKYGQELRESGIYIVKGLSPLINALHDEHYHVDFEKI